MIAQDWTSVDLTRLDLTRLDLTRLDLTRSDCIRLDRLYQIVSRLDWTRPNQTKPAQT